MLIDLVFAIFVVFAVIKGLQRGLIVAVFSMVAVVLGIAAAMKLSLWVAGMLGESTSIPAKWLPVVSFIIVFLGVVLLVRLAANMIQASVEMAALGVVNKIGGVLLYLVIYAVVFSVLLFFGTQLKLIDKKMTADSLTYEYLAPWGPWIINGIGKIIPWFKDMFAELENFFGNLPPKTPQ